MDTVTRRELAEYVAKTYNLSLPKAAAKVTEVSREMDIPTGETYTEKEAGVIDYVISQDFRSGAL